MPRPAPVAPHGTRARYCHWTQPCRCGACREANRRYMAAYRASGPSVRGRYRTASGRTVTVEQPPLFR